LSENLIHLYWYWQNPLITCSVRNVHAKRWFASTKRLVATFILQSKCNVTMMNYVKDLFLEARTR